MTEVRFYHLERRPLDSVLPRMLQVTLERGGRAVVVTGSEERAEQLAGLLWTFDDEAFLPHGTRADGAPDLQPIWLTAVDENPNGATAKFYVDGARPGSSDGLDRQVVIFDGNDEAAVAAARDDWKRLKATAGAEMSYWQQDETGRWVNRA
ncbi:MAG: DNA polymerase III subunit chi [Rhizobiales bacterium]|nr:DNA polymerase III subunit chi [Hyphomicrobiales bacterium]MBI3672040.1 DNA polymerase III subunit chi [Hyphomicrobiales bacterium]